MMGHILIKINHTEFSSQIANEILLPDCNENKGRAVMFYQTGSFSILIMLELNRDEMFSNSNSLSLQAEV